MICSSCYKKSKDFKPDLPTIKLLISLLGNYAEPGTTFNSKEMVEWLKSLQAEHGFRDYSRWRELQILKTLASGLTQEQYWMNVGQRTELLYMAAKSTEVIKKEKVEEEKAKLRVKSE